MLLPDIRDLAQADNFATISTVMPDGSVQTQPMWVDADEVHILMNTELDRQKDRNTSRDPRVTVMVMDRANPYRYAEVRGHIVEVVDGQEARDHIDALSNKYLGKDYPNPIGTARVIWKITPDRQYIRG